MLRFARNNRENRGACDPPTEDGTESDVWRAGLRCKRRGMGIAVGTGQSVGICLRRRALPAVIGSRFVQRQRNLPAQVDRCGAVC